MLRRASSAHDALPHGYVAQTSAPHPFAEWALPEDYQHVEAANQLTGQPFPGELRVQGDTAGLVTCCAS